MKRILSLVLVLVLALGSVPFAFADDAKTAGETLQDLGLAKGVDAEGNLNEEGMLTRAEMMVVISRLLGVEEEAMNYAIPSTSKDVEGHWAAKYIAYAEQVGKWSNGVGNDMFAPQGQVTNQMVAKFMLTALGYEANWETAVQDATALGLMEGVSGEATANITRGNVFKAALNTINTPSKDSDVKLGVSLGVLEPEAPVVVELDGAVIDSVKAVASNLVEINFEEAVDAAAAGNVVNYGITEKASTSNVIVINSVSVEDEDTVLVETATLKNGMAYTVTIDGKTANFSGISKDSDVPTVKSVLGTDTGIVEVTFADALVDKATAEDIANYSINKEGTVVKAELKSDRKVVKLTVEGFTTTSAKTLTIENVLSIEKVSMKKVSKVFFTKFDKFAPTVTLGTQNANNVNVVLNVVDEHGVDKATAEDVANYVIDGLTVLEAKVSKSDDDNEFYDRITLTTSEQTNGKLYNLKVSNLMDGSNAQNVMEKETSISFRGKAADATKPSVTNVKALTTTTIEVTFTELNDLDPATALNPANYELDKDDITILEAKFEDNDIDTDTVILTTTTHPEKVTNFKMTISNVSDEFGNVMNKYSRFFTSAVVDNAKPVINKGLAINDTQVKLTFAKEVKKSVATDPTNYVVNKDIGSPVEAKLDSTGKIVTLTFEGLDANVAYELTVRNIENLYDVVMDEKVVKFIGLAVGVDKDAPTLDSYYLNNVNELRVIFSEDVNYSGSVITATKGSTTITFTEKTVLADGKTVVYAADDDLNLTVNQGDFVVQSISNISDLAGNNFNYADMDKIELSQVGSGDVVKHKLLGWAQEDLKTFIFYFDKEVAISDASMTIGTKAFTLDRDDDDYSVVRAKSSTTISDTFSGTTDIANTITDLIGVVYEDDEVTIDGGLVDETAPTIIDVRPVNVTTIEVEYDEDLSYAGTYYIKESTDSSWGSPISSSNISYEDNIVTITVSSLDDQKIYEFKQNASALAKDVAGNKASEIGTVSFIGVENAAPTNYFYGVEFVNGNVIKLKSSMDFVAGDDITLAGGPVTGDIEATDTVTLVGGTKVSTAASTVEVKVSEFTPFIKDTTYTVTIDGVSTTFDGIVEKLDAIASESSTEIDNATSDATVKLALENYAHDDAYTVTVTGVTVSGSATITDLGVVEFMVDNDNTSSTSEAAVKVLIKNGSNVIYYVNDILAPATYN